MAAKRTGSLIDDIKNQVKKTGSNKGKIVYFKPGVKVRLRFLQEMDEGMKVHFHDSFADNVNVPCQELYGRECKYCDDESLRHRDLYAWVVWDYDANEEKILLGAANNFSPIPALVGMFETYGSITDRDYIITKNGQQTNITFSVVPMDKVVFKNKKAKPFSEEKMLSILDKAFPDDNAEDDDEEEETPKKKKAPAKKQPAKKSKPVEEDEDDWEDDEDEDGKYDDMTPKELYLECIEREIKVKPKQDASYYIEKLVEYDEENEDEDDDGEEW